MRWTWSHLGCGGVEHLADAPGNPTGISLAQPSNQPFAVMFIIVEGNDVSPDDARLFTSTRNRAVA